MQFTDSSRTFTITLIFKACCMQVVVCSDEWYDSEWSSNFARTSAYDTPQWVRPHRFSL